MNGAIPPLPQYAFMAWCSVKRSTGTTLPMKSLSGLTGHVVSIITNYLWSSLLQEKYDREVHPYRTDWLMILITC
jgi:hypothetical protein